MGIDILIPALGRPQNIPTLMESLQETSDYRLVFICSPDDPEQVEACREAGETWVVPWKPAHADFAKKINWGFEHTYSEWVFQGATDIKFTAGWDTTALRVADRQGKDVIGTNDLHNPQVRRRMQATHILFRRSYIEEQGGTFDGSGTVFSEAYDHQYVDLEFCETAKRRNVWAFSPQSIVEHLHPHWGLAPDDATYRKAMRQVESDRRLYQERMGRGSRQTIAQRRMERQRQR